LTVSKQHYGSSKKSALRESLQPKKKGQEALNKALNKLYWKCLANSHQPLFISRRLVGGGWVGV